MAQPRRFGSTKVVIIGLISKLSMEMKGAELTLYLKKVKLEAMQWMQKSAPRIAGKTATDHFTENFQKEGFVNGGLRKWKMVRRKEIAANTPQQQTLAGRPILTGDTANLGRGISYDASRGKTTVFNDVSYASVHNKGASNAGRNRNVVIPKRQFIGNSKELDKKIKKEIEKKLKELTNKKR